MNESCAGCAYLASYGEGYSNWTWEETVVICGRGRNPNLPADEPMDWRVDLKEPIKDNWPATQNSRCEHYRVPESPEHDKPVPTQLDVDGETNLMDEAPDLDAAGWILLNHENRIWYYVRSQNEAKRMLGAIGMTYVPPYVYDAEGDVVGEVRHWKLED